MGDAAGEIWTDVPRDMAVSHPGDRAAWAPNAVTVTVTSGRHAAARRLRLPLGQG